MEFSIAVGATVVGGLFLALVLFLLSDFVFTLPALSGVWRFESETKHTSFNPYKGLKLTYLVLLWQEGHTIHGSGEKVQEDANGVVREYTGEQRSRIVIRGHLTRRFFTKSEVVLHFDEYGERRQSSTIQTLRITHQGALEGTYASTIANSAGATRWVRGADGLKFEGLV